MSAKQLSLLAHADQKTTITVTKQNGESVTAVYPLTRKQARDLCKHFDSKFPEYRHEVKT